MKNKVLILIDSLGVGGAERLLASILKEYKKCYPTVEIAVVLLYNRYDNDLRLEVEKLAKVFVLGVTKKNFFTKGLEFKRVVKKGGYGIVNPHLCDSIIFAKIFRTKGIKLVCSYHNKYYDPNFSKYSWLRHQLDRLFTNTNDFFIFVSKAVKESTLAALKFKGEYKVLENFSDSKFYPAYKRSKKDKTYFVSVGRLIPQKNHQIAIRAFKELRHLNFEYHIYGQGELYSELTELIEISGLLGKVKLCGVRAITSELLSQYDAFLMPSQNEGMPISLIEAMSVGMPVILSDLPEMRETAGVAAVYCDINEVDQLVNYLKDAIDGNIDFEKMSKLSMHISTNFSSSRYIEALHNVYF